MSKIYQALEKAERERQEESKKELAPVPEFQKEETGKEEIRSEPREIGRTASKQPLVSYFQPGSLAAEQIRKLRAYVSKRNNPNSPKTILVTSAVSGEGKTFVAANLAAGIANDLHTHALLIDCDLRKPFLSEWFEIPKSKGLSDYLSGNGTAVSEFITSTELSKLMVFSAGSNKENPTELIGSKKMEALLQELKSQQDSRYIIIDSTPILATTEPEVLGKLVDGIILVVRAGVTPRETVQQAVRSLDAGKILGVVLNDLTFKSSGLYSRYFGSSGYYYKYDYQREDRGARRKMERVSRWVRPWKEKTP